MSNLIEGIAPDTRWILISAFLVIIMLLGCLLVVVNKLQRLRVSEEDKHSAQHNASAELVDLDGEKQKHRRKGDFHTPVSVEPHAEDGQIASEYSRVLGRVKLEIDTREEAVRQLAEESEFRFIFENGHEGIIQFARNGEITKANPAAVRLLGFESDEALKAGVGRWMVRLHGKDRNTKLKAMVNQLNTEGVAREVELSFTRNNDGRDAHVQIDLKRLVTADGTQHIVLASVIDISERKVNERLRMERDVAKAASHAKSEFLANMSHEIRTPLNGVTGMLELLSRTELDSRQNRFIHVAGTSANSLLSVINDILDVSKIESGKLELEESEFSLPKLLADVLDMFAQQAATKDIELASLLPTNIPERVIGDQERVRQVFVNLVGNALKFTDNGSVILRCRVGTVEANRAHLRFTVEDTGVGILPAQKERLFEAFTQADSSTTRKHGGTGLGLNISRQLIELMGGSIEVDSVPGERTVFTVNLAFAVPMQTHNAKSVDLIAKGSDTNSKIRMLAVDDHPINLEILDGMLTPEGYHVTAVQDSLEALSLLDQAELQGKPYKIALLDYQMPIMDGKGLATRIREDKRFEDLRLIMLTSIDQAILAPERAALNIHACITKPLRRSRLFDAINETLGRPVGSTSPVVATAVKDLAAEEIAEARRNAPQVTATALSKGFGEKTSQAKPVIEITSRPLNILIVEDNAVNQMVIDELLRDFGHTTVLSENGAQAIERIEEGDIDLVLMDCQMPVMDGFEATRRIRAMEKEHCTSRLPIIAVTSNAIKGDRERCLNVGMDDYVSKPINTAKLVAAIGSHCENAA